MCQISYFIAEINGLNSLGTDIRNACLEAFAKENVFNKDVQEFGTLQGHDLIINKALNRLRT